MPPRLPPALLWPGAALLILLAARSAKWLLAPDNPATTAPSPDDRPAPAPMEDEGAAARARAQRTRPVADVAPAPPGSSSLPLLGPDGVDAEGYPLAYVNQVGLRALFASHAFADLTNAFTQFEDAFEADPRKEYWPSAAAGAFASGDPALAEDLDLWVAATPDSFAPYLARGEYASTRAARLRGGDVARNTPASDMRAMADALKGARADLQRAEALRPKLVTAITAEIGAASWSGSRAEMRELFDRGVAICPSCMLLRAAYIGTLTPRWGGSYDDMKAFAQSADPKLNPRLRFLAGYADLDRADLARDAKHFEAADAALARAFTLGDFWLFFQERAVLRKAESDWTGSLADFDRAAEMRPGLPLTQIQRAYPLSYLKRWEEAGRALLAGLRIDSTDAYARALFKSVMQGLAVRCEELMKARKKDDALRISGLADEIAPDDPRLRRCKALQAKR